MVDESPHAAERLLLGTLGDNIEASDEETFDLFSHDFPSCNLGFVDAGAKEVQVSIAGKDFTIRQSPGLLSSSRKEGTTGAVVWKVTPLFAEWVSSDRNIFFQSGILDGESLVLELGAGVSGLIALSLAPKIKRYLATDQDYVLKMLRENIAQNCGRTASHPKGRKKRSAETRADKTPAIDVMHLDWETSSASSLYAQTTLVADQDHIAAVIAADCIYNETLIQPLVETCSDVCGLAPEEKPTLCIVVQQLRSPEVFEQWLTAFHGRFRVWRVPDELLSDELKVKNGFAVHVGILRHEERINQ